jgi:glucans biosynthesis protein C
MQYKQQTSHQTAALNNEQSSGKISEVEPSPVEQYHRLYYLDWLRVLAVTGVFLAHAITVFNLLYWHVNESRGQALIALGTGWGITLFFLLAGASAWFSLGSRTARQFISERFARLVIPFVVGVMLLSPLQGYLLDVRLSHYSGTFFQYFPYFFLHIQFNWSPQFLAAYGFHLWFLGFLAIFSALALAPFIYLKSSSGQRVIACLVVMCGYRGGPFLLAIPLALIQLALRALFPSYQGWTDFLNWFVFFVYGYLFLSDARIMKAIYKQGILALIVGVASMLALLLTMYGPAPLRIWEGTPSYSLKFELFQLLSTVVAWSWMLFVLYFGLRFLNISNRLIMYINEAILPFFVLHYLMIVVVFFFISPLDIAVIAKFPIFLALSLAATLIVYELLIRHIPIARRFFGMKPQESKR